MNIGTVVEKITNSLNGIKTPAPMLPPFLLRCLVMQKPGLSAYRIAAKIIENNKKIGIPTEDNPDGSPNKINEFVYNIAKVIVEEFRENASVQVSIPMGSLLIQSNGVNGGGPVVTIGQNLIDASMKGGVW